MRPAIFLLCLILASCKTTARRTTTATTNEPAQPNTAADFPIQPNLQHDLCANERFNLRSFQLLIDDSGSMKGFGPALPDITRWTDVALSNLTASRANSDEMEFKNCLFGTPDGVRCRPGRPTAAGFRGAGDTALDRAVQSARDADLTLIFTDGIAATSTGASAECAGGVDSVCVASKLAQFLAPEPGQDRTMRGGLWLIPVRVMFNGTLYTEERIPLASFQKDEAQRAAEQNLATKVTIDKPVQASGGLLQFQYAGLRHALLIVTAKRVETGRMAVRELVRGNPNAAGTPIELFPGYIPPPADFTVAAETSRQGKKNFVRYGASGDAQRIDCDPDATGQLTFTSTTGSNCTKIISLPALNIRPVAPVRAFTSSNTIRLACADIRTCAAGGTTLPFPVALAKDRTLPALNGAFAQYDTTSLARHPHRVLYFTELLKAFYRVDQPVQLPDWHTLKLCR